MTDDGVAAPGRVALFGDVGAHAEQLRAALVDLGADPVTLELPADLTVVQVGDLIHRGPDTPGSIAIARAAMARQPDQWVQLAGNHESYYLTPPRFHWPERLPEDDLETLYEWWRTRRMRVATSVEIVGESCRYLVTHAGLTEGFWRHFIGMPGDAATAASPPQSGLTQRSIRMLHCDLMHRAHFTFAYFWFSHRTGGGEANA